MKKIHVVAAMIRKGDRIFATQRGYGDLRGGWEFPGGKVQEGETPQEALVREIKEELDTEITVGKQFDTVEYDYPDFHLSMECYWCTLVEGQLILKEHMNSKWLKADEIDSVDWLPADLTLIDRLKKEGFAIRNLVFDVGSVLLHYRWKDMLLEYGLDESRCNQIGEEMFDSSIWTERFDRGTMSHLELMDYFDKKYPEDSDAIRWLILHPKDMKVDQPDIWRRVRILKEKGYHIYLLSNYSEYLFKSHTEGLEFMDILDGKVVSYELNYVKPEHKIYQYLLDKYKLKKEECLFFDDRFGNVHGAHAAGMDAVVVSSKKMFLNLLDSMIEEI